MFARSTGWFEWVRAKTQLPRCWVTARHTDFLTEEEP